MYNARPYFSLQNLGKKSAHYTWQNTAGISTAVLLLQLAHVGAPPTEPTALQSPL